MQHITITSTDYTIEAMRADWADDPELTHAEIMACADAEYAYLINNTGQVMRGWAYTGAGFSGPVRADVIQQIGALQMAAADYVLSVLREIKAECAAAVEPVEPVDMSRSVFDRERCSAAGTSVRTDDLAAYAAPHVEPGSYQIQVLAHSGPWASLMAVRPSEVQGWDIDLRDAHGGDVTVQSCFPETTYMVRLAR
jgi:hypothetical protein